ncbi:MAG: class I SAM-dependent methyltransferase [Patescibacteria group bacterium]|jgi:SAM-dependent methyltransferase
MIKLFDLFTDNRAGANKDIEAIKITIRAYDQNEAEYSDYHLDRILGIKSNTIESKIRQRSLSQKYGFEQFTYQGTPYGYIRELLQVTKPGSDDIFYDLGSGYGRLPLYGAITTEAKYIGVEIVAERIRMCQQIKSRFKLSNVEFIQDNVLNVDYADGTIFFLFNPFAEPTLERVGRELEQIAKRKKITIATWGGNSDDYFWQQSWLESAYKGKRIIIFKSL